MLDEFRGNHLNGISWRGGICVRFSNELVVVRQKFFFRRVCEMRKNWHSLIKPWLKVLRKKRLDAFTSAFAEIEEMSVLDVGGSALNWEIMGVRPKRLVLLNLLPIQSEFENVVADARCMPFRDNEFDLVFSNSVIEHVGNIDDQKRFAKEFRRVGKEIYLQTPNKMSIIEPHIIMPIVHWTPQKLFFKLARLSPWALFHKKSKSEVEEFVRSINLLDSKELLSLFPESNMQYEMFFGMKKSLIICSRKISFY